MADKFTGRVKFFDAAKGYGFITRPGGGKDVFVHKTGIPSGHCLMEGEEVSFSIVASPKGDKAVEVFKL